MADETAGLVTRRALLTAGTGTVVAGLVAGLARPAAADWAEPRPPTAAGTLTADTLAARSVSGHPAVRSAFTFLDTMLDAYPDHNGRVRLPQSHADQVGLYSTAFAYDAAVTLLAYLADDRAESVDRARVIGDALVYAQEHDPEFSDGRLRQAYNVAPYTLRGGEEQPYGFITPDGTVNMATQFRFIGSGTGDLAWVGLALATLARRVLDARYLAASVRLGEWIEATCRSAAPLGGYGGGLDRSYRRVTRGDTAHNAVLAAWFDQLLILTGDVAWRQRRRYATEFVNAMWEPGNGFWYPGSEDGQNPEALPLTTPAQTLPQLALRPRDGGAVDWLAARLTVTDTADSPNSTLTGNRTVSGITYSEFSALADPDVPIEAGLPAPDPDAVWLEGTAQLACALLDRAGPGDLSAALTLLNSLVIDQSTLANPEETVGDRPLPRGLGLVAASSPLHTGVGDTGYYPYRHTAATAWFVLAATSTNPVRPDVIPPFGSA